MGLFSRSNKDKKDKESPAMNDLINTLLSNTLKYLEGNMQKDNKDRNIILFLYHAYFKSRGKIEITADIYNFESLLNDILSIDFFQKAWNDIKEKYEKDIDEQELFRVFMFYAFMNTLWSTLEDAKKQISPIGLINNETNYNHYKSLFGGKLDKEAYKELIAKIAKYINGEFYEKYLKNKEQKDEQPK